MQIEWKNKNRPIYYPSVCLIASNFTTDQGNLKFKGIHLSSTPLIKYFFPIFFFFSLPQSYVPNIFLSRRRGSLSKERRKRNYWSNHHLSCFFLVYERHKDHAHVSRISYLVDRLMKRRFINRRPLDSTPELVVPWNKSSHSIYYAPMSL